MKILIIDDDKTFLDKMKKVLILDHHAIETAINGEKSLEILSETQFDLILMDLKMPGLSGGELIREIKERGFTSIIIVITGYGTIETAVETIKAGAYDYLLKPFDFSDLRKKIEEVEAELSLRRNIALSTLSEKSKTGEFLELENLSEYARPLLVISDENPTEIIKEFNISQAVPIWLNYSSDGTSIVPTKLHTIKTKIEEFAQQNNEGTIVFKGIEELLKIHKWDNFKQFLIHLQSEILSSNFSLLLLIEKNKGMIEGSCQVLLNDALSFFINPVVKNIIELLSHPVRINIITLLKSEDRLNFNRIVKKLDISRSSNLAFHITILKKEGILKKEDHLYSLSSRGTYIAELISLFEKLGFSDPHSQVKVFHYSKSQNEDIKSD